MSVFPKKPQAGERVLQGLFDSVNQIIDYLPSLRVSGDNKTIKVSTFKSGTIVEAIQKPSSGGRITTEENSEEIKTYNGYFTLKHLGEDSERGIIKIAVCDGETWDSETNKSNYSIAYVNDKMWRVSSKVFDIDVKKPNNYFLIKYNHVQNKMELVCVDNLPSYSFEEIYYIIGELYDNGSSVKVIQRHGYNFGTNYEWSTNGAAYMWLVGQTCIEKDTEAEGEE